MQKAAAGEASSLIARQASSRKDARFVIMKVVIGKSVTAQGAERKVRKVWVLVVTCRWSSCGCYVAWTLGYRFRHDEYLMYYGRSCALHAMQADETQGGGGRNAGYNHFHVRSTSSQGEFGRDPGG